MKLNQKGFTLIELMATLLIIAVVMGITIPNVTGIFNQGKVTTYAEDAKKLRTSAEYMFRGDNTVVKPTNNGECIAISLAYLDNDEYNPPYGGRYLQTKSFIIVKMNVTNSGGRDIRKYSYHVQLIESLPDYGYRGFRLVDASLLDGDGYFDMVGEFGDADGFADLTNYIANPNSLKSHGNLGSLCSSVLKVYTPEPDEE